MSTYLCWWRTIEDIQFGVQRQSRNRCRFKAGRRHFLRPEKGMFQLNGMLERQRETKPRLADHWNTGEEWNV